MKTGFSVQSSGFRSGSFAHSPIRPFAHSTVRRGLSIVEVLISLSISAMLLTAVAAAFTASSAVIRNNDEFFRASQAARVSMNQLLTEIRRCSALTVHSDGKGMDMLTDDLEDRTYQYDDSATLLENKVLKLITNDITTDPDYTLARSISSMTFTADTETGEGGVTYVARVSITIVLDVGDNRIRLTGSAAPRRVQTYGE